MQTTTFVTFVRTMMIGKKFDLPTFLWYNII